MSVDEAFLCLVVGHPKLRGGSAFLVVNVEYCAYCDIIENSPFSDPLNGVNRVGMLSVWGN